MFKNNEATLIIIFLIFSIVSTFAIVVWHGWIVDTDQKYSYAYIHSYTQKKYLSVNLIGVGENDTTPRIKFFFDRKYVSTK